MADDSITVKERYERALTNLTETLQQDKTLLAAILGGSLSYDEVWEKSDIDLVLIGDEKHKEAGFCLVEEGINVHASILPRSAFKKAVEGGLQGAFFHSFLSKSRLLYTHDESLYALYDNLQKIGAQDRAWQLFRVACGIPMILAKAEKWFTVKRDYRYAFVYVLGCVENLARIEILSHGQIPTREVVQHALRLNPAFFQQVYIDLIDGPKNEQTVGDAITAVNRYLDERIQRLFGPLFEYLTEAGVPRSVTEIKSHFRRRVADAGAEAACEWLSDKGYIDKVELPLRLSDRSRVTVKEAAYYYHGEPG